MIPTGQPVPLQSVKGSVAIRVEGEADRASEPALRAAIEAGVSKVSAAIEMLAARSKLFPTRYDGSSIKALARELPTWGSSSMTLPERLRLLFQFRLDLSTGESPEVRVAVTFARFPEGKDLDSIGNAILGALRATPGVTEVHRTV